MFTIKARSIRSMLGAGPRGRRFKSSRPDQFLVFVKKIRNTQPGWSLGFLLRVSVLGTEWPVAQRPTAVGIIRDFSPLSVAIVPLLALLERKPLPRHATHGRRWSRD